MILENFLCEHLGIKNEFNINSYQGKMLVGEGKFKMCKTDYYYFMYYCTCMMITFYK